MQRHKKKLQWVILLFVVLSLAAYAIYGQLIKVRPFYYQQDPEIVYFMNSLGILDGNPYYFADHPGTPVNIAGTVILLLLRPLTALQGTADFTDYMLHHPGDFLLVARLFINLLNILAVIFIWWYCKDKVSLAALVLILTSYFVAYRTGVWYTTVYWSHNAVTLSLGTTFLFIMYHILNTEQLRTTNRLVWLGVGTGFLASIQLYFVAWIIGLLATIFFLYLIEKRTWRTFVKSIGAVVGGFVAAFIVINLPILHRFPYMFGWFGDIFSHMGRYGSGDVGVFSLPAMWENFRAYQAHGFTRLFAAVAVLLIGLMVLAVWQRNFSAKKVLWAVAAGVGVQTIVVCLMILKHAGSLYLLALAASLPVLLFIWFSLQPTANRWWQLFYMAVACLALLMFMRQINVAFMQINHDKIEDRDAFITSYLTEYAAQHNKTEDELQIFIGYNIAFNRCGSLRFGNYWYNNFYEDKLDEICPNINLWNYAANGFVIDGDKIPFTDYDDWDVIIISTRVTQTVDFLEMQAGVTIEQLDHDLMFVVPD